MKKCTLILMVVLTIAACKKEKVDEPVSSPVIAGTSPNQDSINLDSYYTCRDIVEKVSWLKDSGKLVYKNVLKEAVLKDHKLQGTIIYKNEKYIRTWGELRKMIKNNRYENYLNVEFKGKKITGLQLVPDYIHDKDTTYCFSPVLIRSLGEEYAKKNDNAEFQFSFATITVNNKKIAGPVVIIQVVGDPSSGHTNNEAPYYDYSTDPKKKKLNTPNIPL
ncbi:MAG TPA: hypothetical protein VF465_09000 [Flavobacterium sp.]|uniref:hypothetical protein n=1 Tax=Flavobacterium sp. TaxID=239 RepID=UPI002ED693DA